MSLGDWIADSAERYRETPLMTATRESVAAFIEGIDTRLAWLVHSRFGGPAASTELAGEELYFFVNSPHDLQRARNGIREQPVLEWLVRGVSEETTFWDVGAFHGTFAAVAAVKGADVIAFEPATENMTRLSRNAALNAVEIDRRAVALSDRDAIRQFGASDTPGSELAIGNGGRSVTTVRGDTVEPKPDIVKIDVEGHELAVLDGMEQALRSVNRVVIETHRGVDPEAVARRLQAAGLETHEVMTGRAETYIAGAR